MPRYVLLRHECPPSLRTGSHWDLMLESDGELQTWALEQLPSVWAESLGLTSSGREEVPATRLAVHRLAYLEYEGPVRGDRGTVRRVAEGAFEWKHRVPAKHAWGFLTGALTGAAEIAEAHGVCRLRIP